MRLLILAPVLAIALLGGSSALPAAAAPENNKNATIFDVTCEGLGDFEVTSVDHAAAAFAPDGQVFVAISRARSRARCLCRAARR